MRAVFVIKDMLIIELVPMKLFLQSFKFNLIQMELVISKN